MMHGLLALILAAAAVPAASQTIEVGKADWKKFPTLVSAERRLPYEQMAGGVEELLATGQCKLPGQSARRFDITVPYAVRIEPSGQASRIVVADMGCKPLEMMVGNLVADMAELGDFRAAAAGAPKWYSSKINFAQE